MKLLKNFSVYLSKSISQHDKIRWIVKLEKEKNSLIVGGLLILIGIIFLLNNLRYIYIEDEALVSFLFLGAGAYFFLRYRREDTIGLLILASTLAFVGLVILLESIPGFDSQYIGTLFLWGMSALFAYGFFRNNESWWWLIPAGVFFTLGSMVILERMPFIEDESLGSVFFLGIGLTFGFLYLIRNEQNGLHWAKYPALVLIIFSGFIYAVSSDSWVAELFLPIALILVGGFLVFHSTKTRSSIKNA